jgi:predicted phosphodiesterase
MRLLFLGDIHGNFKIVKYYISIYDIKDANIIQLGDFGVGFESFNKEKKDLEFVNYFLVKNNVHLWAIRGNHDFKPYFDKDPFGLSNIHLVSDYSVLNLSGKNILFVGGAISIDREWRYTNDQRRGDYSIKPGQSWWKDEIFTLDKDKISTLRNIDIVVTHTCPSYCSTTGKNIFDPFVKKIIKDTGDINLKDELIEERQQLDDLFYLLKLNNNIKYAYYGHFHKSECIEHDGTKFRLLGINELWEEKDYKNEE